MLQGASGTEFAFMLCALVGTLFFVLRAGMMIVAGFGAAEIDDLDPTEAPAHHSGQLEDSDPAFKLLSINSLTGFFMMFGWIGLAAHKQFQLGAGVSVLLAFAAGLATMAVTGLLFKAVLGLQTTGSRFDATKAVGLPASVYVSIPAGGRGQIRISHEGLTRTLDALAEDGLEIESFVNVIVLNAVDSKTVVVKRA